MSPSRRQKSSYTKEKKAISLTNQEFENIGRKISITAIELPNKQPRRSFNPTKMRHLTESVRKYGILEPLIVRPLNSQKYELVAGERRYKAAKKVGLTEVPVIIRELDEKEAFELALLENLQRDDLNPIDETEGMLELLCQSLNCNRDDVISLLNQAANAQRRDTELTDNVTRQIKIVDGIFLSVGRLSRESYRTNRLPLLNLPGDVLEVLRNGELEYTKAKAIAKLNSKQLRGELMQQVVHEKTSLKQLKEKIKELQQGDTISPKHNSHPISTTTTVESSIKLPNNTLSPTFDIEEDRLRAKLINLYQAKSDAWRDKNKQKEIDLILSKLEKVLMISESGDSKDV